MKNNGNVKPVIDQVLAKRQLLLNRLQNEHTPCYMYDAEATTRAAKHFYETFQNEIPAFHAYYAMKSNPHPLLVKNVLQNGFGIDVSSGRELQLALDAGATDIIFTGPGKTNQELKLAVGNNDKVLINIDSFGELYRLHLIASEAGIQVKAGVRICLKVHGSWNKFGIDIAELHRFWKQAATYEYINLQSIQMHMSWNETVEPYEKAFQELSEYLRTEFTEVERSEIKSIDFGGGFLPQNMNGEFAGDPNEDNRIPTSYTISTGLSVIEYAKGIRSAINRYMKDLLDCRYVAEPGRIVSSYAMHIAIRVVDVKKPGVAIVEGGNNMIGWEQFEWEYHPVVNLTHPSSNEIPFLLYGSLCTPHDIWGYFCYGAKVEDGDILFIPNQGAYTYTLAQNFIKAIPQVIVL